MKVKELIEALQDEDPEAEVHFAYDYGDHWHTKVAPKVRTVESVGIKYSTYHRMPQVVENDDAEDDNDTGSYAVVLSATAR